MKRSATGGSAREAAAFALTILAPLLLTARPGSASVEERRPFEYDLLFPKSTEGQVPGGTIVGPEIAPALEEPIDPALYQVVSGDLYQLEVGGETDRAWRMAVSAEGMLLLPGAESIDVTGHTLATVESLVRDALAARFPGKPIFLHLLQPGMFRIFVTGAVASPGVQAVHGYDRVAYCIGAAGGPLPGGSIRHVSMTYPDGTEREFDLVRFALLGDLDQNPLVVPGMRIQVPPAREFIQVTGAVRGVPGLERPIVPNVGSRIPESPRPVLEWREGDTMDFAITRAGGVSEDAASSVFLLRGPERRLLSLAVADTLLLQPNDLIEVAVRDRWVFVTGAVRYPGPYAYLPSLSAPDYVRLAGGPTELGRGSGWKLLPAGGGKKQAADSNAIVTPGATIHVSERYSYRLSTIVTPLAGLTALVLSIVALASQ
jgi:protein involved in polysaccharide export with SLBB domain